LTTGSKETTTTTTTTTIIIIIIIAYVSSLLGIKVPRALQIMIIT